MYMHIYIYTGWNWDSGDIYDWGFVAVRLFSLGEHNTKMPGAWGNDRERETDTKVAGCIEAKHVHVSRHRSARVNTHCPVYI